MDSHKNEESSICLLFSSVVVNSQMVHKLSGNRNQPLNSMAIRDYDLVGDENFCSSPKLQTV